MSHEEFNFEDHELKAAINRARGGHVASDGLREKVMSRLAEVRAELETAPGGSNGQPVNGNAVPLMRIAGTEADATLAASKKTKPSRRPWYLSRTFFAAAAMLIISIGAASMYINHLQHEAEEREEYVEMNRPLLLAMIDSLYNRGSADQNPQPVADTSDPRALSKEMSKRLGRAVPPVSLAGWKIDNISIVKVNTAEAGRWQMSKDGKRVTVLSLPASAFNIEEYEDYDFRLNDHAIAGFLRQGSINCVVCEPSFSDAEAIKLRNELKRG
jgi:hypothetical protein